MKAIKDLINEDPGNICNDQDMSIKPGTVKAGFSQLVKFG